MNTVKILHCSDIHIGAPQSFLGTLAIKRRLEVLMTFERIVDIATENNVELVAIAGDLFDSNKVEKQFVDSVFSKIASASKIKFIVCAGNHDPLDSCSPFANNVLPENLFILNAKDSLITFDDLKLNVYGNSFNHCYKKGSSIFGLQPLDNGYINLMVIHGDLTTDLNSNYNAISPDFVKNSGMDYIALGHVHKAIPISKLKNCYFAYCGCPEGQGFDELEEKGVYLGKIGKNLCELEFVSTAKRLHIHQKINIEDCSDTQQIIEKILSLLQEKYSDDFSENLYKIELLGKLSEEFIPNIEEITERLSQKLFFVRIENSTETLIDFEKIAQESSLKGLFVKTMLEKIANVQENEKERFKKALTIGLKAFDSEVLWNED